MSAQTFHRASDAADQRISILLETNILMLTIMHAALMEIVQLTPSLDGGVAMRAIAEDAIAQVQAVAPGDHLPGRNGAAFQPEVKYAAAAA